MIRSPVNKIVVKVMFIVVKELMDDVVFWFLLFNVLYVSLLVAQVSVSWFEAVVES